MGWVLPVITMIFGIVVFVVVVIIKIRGSKIIGKMDVGENAPLLELGARSKFTKGYARGLVKSQVKCKNGCTRLEFFPTDFEQGENKKRPQMKVVIVKDEFIKRLATGEGDSSYRQVIRCVDNVKADIPEKLWGTNVEKDMLVEGQKAYLKSMAGKMSREGHKAMAEHISEWTDLGMNKLTLATLKEKNDLLKQLQGITNLSTEKK